MNFDMKYFYAVGRVVFTIVILGNLYTLYYHWGNTLLPSKVSGIAMIVFYCMLVWMFHHNYKGLKGVPSVTEADMNSVLADIGNK